MPSAIKSYHELNVKHEPLKLITPQFETPLPPLQAAVFPPSFRFEPSEVTECFAICLEIHYLKSYLQLATETKIGPRTDSITV